MLPKRRTRTREVSVFRFQYSGFGCRLFSFLALCIVFCSSAASHAAGAGEGKRVYELAKPRVMPDGAPKASDVIMRSLTLRVAKGKNSCDTFQALSDFHVTRLEWAYIRNPDFIAKACASGRVFGGAASSALSHVAKTEGGLDYEDLACVNLNGVPVIPTWKRAWRPPGNLWMCANNPAVERCYVEYLKSCLDAGAQVMQRDEPGGNENAVSWGGCFCDHCMRAFRGYLAKNAMAEKLKIGDIDTFDYRDLLRRDGAPVGDDFRRFDGGDLKQLFVQFQIDATVAFHHRTRRALNECVGRRVAMSCNNGCRRWTPIELEFDWCFGELSYRHAKPDFVHGAMQQATEQGRCQVITMPKKSNHDDLDAWQRLTRQSIAMAYACGGHCMVPWDVYMPGDAPRYFGTPEQYADLFGFVRASSQYLDGYEYAGAFGAGIECNLFGDDPPVRIADNSRVCAIMRAVPARSDGAVVVHLVDWSDNPRPFRLTLNPAAIFGDKALKMKLLVPAAYDKATHEKAEETRSYEALSKTIPLEGGYVSSVSVPALKPWGLLVVEPADTLDAGVWQPVIWTADDGLYREKLVLQMKSASRDATIHYTTDGSAPSKASPRYETSIELAESATVNAVAVLPGGRTSRVASVSFKKGAGRPQPVPPDDARLEVNLKLWLKADSLALRDGEPVEEWTANAGPNAVAKPHKTFDGTLTQPPTFMANALCGRPVIRFDGVDDSLAVKGFANRYLAGKAFTIFMVAQSETDGFGICGNGIWGTGGDPRLYLQRSAFRYNELTKAVNLRPDNQGPAISVFMHDGDQTISAATNGVLSTPVSGLPAVSEFGSGGNLAMPFWSGNTNCPGDIAEIAVFDRKLTDAERIGVEVYLADKYGIKYVRRWE